ncbi:transglycosylase domain-containing protein [Desulfuribacillus stibiiarsenatis]|uniref:transglycosylase domain-containing protein n=1 Tax=Desulfuribacillus stibiiarsenatis TaxID=1390249 RepID=UPI0015B722C9|nr:biosynthetic peptidoglycan transglycosylase [Desulfuribacillus stibiiarsenatis]
MGLFVTYHSVSVGIYLATYPQLLTNNVLEITDGESQIITFPRQLPVANESEFGIQYVTKDEISPALFMAIVAIEDARFYEHSGVDYYAILRAVYYNAFAKEYLQGGSTITQQLAKNLYLNPDKRLSRKLAEVYLARKLEAQFPKDDILEMYVNQSYYGQGMYGVERAANYYFRKKARQLDYAEASFLAGLLQAPSFYSNPNNRELAYVRQDLVLKLMVNQNLIRQDEAEKSLESFRKRFQ